MKASRNEMPLEPRTGAVPAAFYRVGKVAGGVKGAGLIGGRSEPPHVGCHGIGGWRRRNAFTLIELLLAITIFAVVIAAISGVFYGAMRLRNKTTEMVEAAQPMERAASVLRRDLQNVVMPGGTISGVFSSQSATTAGTEGALSGFEFYTSTGVMDERSPYAEVQKVAYVVRNPLLRNGPPGRELVRLVTRNLLSDTTTLPDEEILLQGVSEMAFAFYDGSQWQNAWDSQTATTNLPTAVKVQVTFEEERNLLGTRSSARPLPKAPLQLLTPIMVMGKTNDVSGTGGAS